MELAHEMALDVMLPVSEEQQIAVEEATRDQANNRLWFRFRTGRITASKMHTTLHTNPNMPAISLIKSICYPQAHKFQVASTSWGCDHEQHAIHIYTEHMENHHRNFKITPSGFFISLQAPFIGASPDSLVSCDCCGLGVVEIKCPYCHRDDEVDEASADPKFCVSEGVLKTTHPYYVQIQTQLNVCEREYCDFFLWLKNDNFLQRITRDAVFWEEMVSKAEIVFRNGVLPELLGKCFTRIPKMTVKNNLNMQQYCYCNGSVTSQMFACSKQDCELKYFHLECLNLKHVLKKSWVCPDCRNTNKNNAKKTD
jgi:hypothetical protein